MPERFLIGAEEFAPNVLERGFLFDTNVWLYLQGPLQDHTSAPARAYSRFFSAAIQGGGRFFLPQLVASEFVNRSLTLLAKASGWVPGGRKLHQEAGYPMWAKDACDSLHAVESDCSRVNDGFEGLDLSGVYSKVEETRLDFHDHLIADLCRLHGLTLVTHDGDFRDEDIPIVTANRRIV